ncbi:hypothetical protein GCM10010524_20240 [Streptomyces mexicanus]
MHVGEGGRGQHGAEHALVEPALEEFHGVAAHGGQPLADALHGDRALGERHQQPVAVGDGPDRQHRARHRLRRVLHSGPPRRVRVRERPHRVVDERADQGLAAGEVAVHRAPYDTRGAGDLVHGRVGVPQQFGERHVEDAAPVRVGAAGVTRGHG